MEDDLIFYRALYYGEEDAEDLHEGPERDDGKRTIPRMWRGRRGVARYEPAPPRKGEAVSCTRGAARRSRSGVEKASFVGVCAQ